MFWGNMSQHCVNTFNVTMALVVGLLLMLSVISAINRPLDCLCDNNIGYPRLELCSKVESICHDSVLKAKPFSGEAKVTNESRWFAKNFPSSYNISNIRKTMSRYPETDYSKQFGALLFVHLLLFALYYILQWSLKWGDGLIEIYDQLKAVDNDLDLDKGERVQEIKTVAAETFPQAGKLGFRLFKLEGYMCLTLLVQWAFIQLSTKAEFSLLNAWVLLMATLGWNDEAVASFHQNVMGTTIPATVECTFLAGSEAMAVTTLCIVKGHVSFGILAYYLVFIWSLVLLVSHIFGFVGSVSAALAIRTYCPCEDYGRHGYREMCPGVGDRAKRLLSVADNYLFQHFLRKGQAENTPILGEFAWALKNAEKKGESESEQVELFEVGVGI